MIRWNEVCAVFGGTFDPPHIGHKMAVQGLFSHPGVKKVRIIPSAIPVGKATLTSAEDRIAMAKLCFLQNSSGAKEKHHDLEIDLREIERARVTGKPSYTYDSLLELIQIEKNLACVIGTDQFSSIEKWHRFPEVLNLCHWIILKRKGEPDTSLTQTIQRLRQLSLIESIGDQSFQLKGSKKELLIVETRAPALSSTQIRTEIAKTGQFSTETLMPSVSSYLKEHALYGSQKIQ